jgi:hypothetical protein
MALVVCEDCRHDVSDRACACPHCGRPAVAPEGGRAWTFDLAAVVGIFGLASIAYSFVFPEEMAVSETRVKFWFGFQLLAMAFAFLAVGRWKQTRAPRPR